MKQNHLVPEPDGLPEIDRAALTRLVRGGRPGDMITLWQQHELTQVAPKRADFWTRFWRIMTAVTR